MLHLLSESIRLAHLRRRQAKQPGGIIRQKNLLGEEFGKIPVGLQQTRPTAILKSCFEFSYQCCYCGSQYDQQPHLSKIPQPYTHVKNPNNTRIVKKVYVR